MNDKKKLTEAEELIDQLVNSDKYYFSELKPTSLPKCPGVYAIFNKVTGENMYVGRTKNLCRRLYNNHLMGPISNARLKKYLIDDVGMVDITDMEKAKQFLKDFCYFQILPIEDVKRRGQIEGMLSFFLDVRYIHEEH